MCRSIKVLRRVEESAEPEEIRAAALQFVRKVSGTRTPSRVATPAFEAAVDEVAGAAARLLLAMGPRRARVTASGPATPPP
jgi:hypothetical protein